LRSIYRFLFWITGWKTRGAVPTTLKQYVMIIAPHTSNWDFFVGIASRSILKLETKYAAKKELFRFPFGGLFKALGGFPVDRSKNNNFVDAVADLYKVHPVFSIAITPEGTRSYVPVWKTGFYYIAQKAGIPVVMVGFNYAKKEVAVEAPYYLTGNMEQDIEFMKNHYRKIPGKNPENGVR